jgi:hypothetical protein
VDFDQFTDVVKQLGYYWLLVNQPPVRDASASGSPPSEQSDRAQSL